MVVWPVRPYGCRTAPRGAAVSDSGSRSQFKPRVRIYHLGTVAARKYAHRHAIAMGSVKSHQCTTSRTRISAGQECRYLTEILIFFYDEIRVLISQRVTNGQWLGVVTSGSALNVIDSGPNHRVGQQLGNHGKQRALPLPRRW